MSRIPDPERSANGRIGGYTRASMYDSREMTAPARRAFDESFARKVDPDGVLQPAERARRAEAARRAYFLTLAHRSAAARRKARELTAQADSAEAELNQAGDTAA